MISALDGSDDPNPQSASGPTKCSPSTCTTPTPEVGPADGRTENTTALARKLKSILPVLKPYSLPPTSTVVTPAACAGATHATSTQPMVHSPFMHRSSPPTNSPWTTSKPNLHCTISPPMPLPMTRTIVPPLTGPASGTTACTTAEEPYSNAASDTPKTSSLKLASTGTKPPSRAGVAHSTPPPAAREVTGPIVPNRHDDEGGACTELKINRAIVPPLWRPSLGSNPNHPVGVATGGFTLHERGRHDLRADRVGGSEPAQRVSADEVRARDLHDADARDRAGRRLHGEDGRRDSELELDLARAEPAVDRAHLDGDQAHGVRRRDARDFDPPYALAVHAPLVASDEVAVHDFHAEAAPHAVALDSAAHDVHHRAAADGAGVGGNEVNGRQRTVLERGFGRAEYLVVRARGHRD
eukprot:30087-Pelagococcus_subviridis.AAC.12